jgi:ABC-type uncharacterized transport system permease subunit
MFQLPPMERSLIWGMLVCSCLGAGIGLMQTAGRPYPFRRLIAATTAMGTLTGAVLLGLRAAALRAFPMSDIFESMITLIILIGAVFLVLSVSIRQPWFSSVMAWVFFIMVLLSAAVARPAASLQQAAQTPWVAVHALSMVLAAAMILLSAAASVLFLLSSKRLKNRQLSTLFGKMPSVEKLEVLILTGLGWSFTALTVGLLSGIGMAAVKSKGLQMTPVDWLTDSKIVLVILAWLLLGAILLLRKSLAWSGKTVAKMTLAACFLILFAFIGSQILCKSAHDFSVRPTETRQTD